MLCSLILYSLNNIIQYYTLLFRIDHTYNILSASSAVKKSSSYKENSSSYYDQESEKIHILHMERRIEQRNFLRQFFLVYFHKIVDSTLKMLFRRIFQRNNNGFDFLPKKKIYPTKKKTMDLISKANQFQILLLFIFRPTIPF